VTVSERASTGLTKGERIRKRREYLLVQQAGQRVKLPHYLLVLQAAAEPRAHARLGITASRRVGCAVVRNRAKRLVREAFRATRDLFPKDIDVVVIVREAPLELGLAEVIAEWRSAERVLRSRIEQARRARDRAD
jgi:ribonuclease P protein component